MEKLWKWKITAMLHKTHVLTLWQSDVGNDAIMNRINFTNNMKTYK